MLRLSSTAPEMACHSQLRRCDESLWDGEARKFQSSLSESPRGGSYNREPLLWETQQQFSRACDCDHAIFIRYFHSFNDFISRSESSVGASSRMVSILTSTMRILDPLSRRRVRA